MRGERLLPYAFLAAAGCVFASELMATFKVQTTAGQAFCLLEASDRHHYALLVLAVFAVVALSLGLATGSKPAVRAAAVCGAASLLIFLVVDLPHANQLGTLGSSCDPSAIDFTAKAVPQAGFFLELMGALLMTLTGAAMATLDEDRLAAITPSWLRRGPGPKTEQP